MNILVILTRGLPIGTNFALLQFLYMLVSGALLPQRGALFPALKGCGLSDPAVRRAWAAFRRGAWSTPMLLQAWQTYVLGLPDWQTHCHAGYRAIVADTTPFWRPALKGCPSKHYHPEAGRALPAVVMGIIGVVGEIGGQRIALPLAFARVHPKDPREARLWAEMLRQLKKTLTKEDLLVVDAGVHIQDLQQAQITGYVVRLATNFTARRNVLPPRAEKGRPPEYGMLVRPLERRYKTKVLAKSDPDRLEAWEEHGRQMRAEIWQGLVLPKVKVDSDAKTFNVYVINDPLYPTPWVLATPLLLQASTVKAIYQDRWPVEQIPLAAKQMVGAHREFVWAKESIQRLPELALLAGSILTFLAATSPLAPTGFWDRHPQRTPGRFRRCLMGKPFPQSYPLPEEFRKKASVTAHLPKGNLAPRQKMTKTTSTIAP